MAILSSTAVEVPFCNIQKEQIKKLLNARIPNFRAHYTNLMVFSKS